ncbi:unnamed protein product [Cyclocybe aegerita]|uniref:Elongation factor Ts, mitochondrial n=1 Tax=Cyclocybe aegerita TaxID=1973307 RepID=A0A8S0W062_CYCAE|nr:unnamed protein product [Cyclocybe aegerita]
MLTLTSRRHPTSFIRTFQRCSAYSTAPPPPAKVPLALVAELRKQTQVSISKAREALFASNGSIPGALEWLKNDLATSGAKKAAKVASRETKEGLVSTAVLSPGAGFPGTVGAVRAALVELNCETDFVARNDLFAQLAADIAHTAAYMSEAKEGAKVGFASVGLEELKEFPLISKSNPGAVSSGTTVATAIRDTIVKVGENISLRRASAIVEDAPLVPSPSTRSVLNLGSYIHGGLSGLPCGRVASLILLNLRSSQISQLLQQEIFRQNLAHLNRALARQIVGFETLSIQHSPDNEVPELALYNQEFVMLGGDLASSPVEQALRNWSLKEKLTESSGEKGGVDVVDFLKWKVGEGDA